MNLKQVIVNNSGMSQDMSISKQDDKFAFENKNIRIQATDDGTLLSITNLRNPKPKNTVNIPCKYVMGNCVTPEYLVLFCTYNDNGYDTDCIYRIDLKLVDSDINDSWKILYKSVRGANGGLNFNTNSHFDTLYHEEGKNVKKVYWVDGVNRPRVINLITPKEIETGGATFASYDTNVFEFYPNIYKQSTSQSTSTLIPSITASKNRGVASELPAGIVQYFISYYTVNGAETLIAASSDTYTIDFTNRGARADETGMCAFDIEIPAANVNGEFDYIRVYSAIRTVENGPLIVKIVGDIKIDKDTSSGVYRITDTGIGQEQLQDSYIYFIGGTPFIAKTLTEKDDTVFFGNIKTENILVSSELKSVIADNCFKEDGRSSNVITFSLKKEIPLNKSQFGNKYQYSLQLSNGSKSYKTFKSGEWYRFGIQFQTLQGQWSDVVWIGDAECVDRPSFDSSTNSFKVNDATFVMPNEVKVAAEAEGYVAYRILYADPENSNGRKIKAQGVLCPTMFTPGQRAQNSPYSLPSWIMRPKNPKENGVAYHHFEPIFSSAVQGGEIASFTPSKVEDSNILYPTPFYKENAGEDTSDCYIVTYIVVGNSNKLIVRSVKIWADEDTVKNNFYNADGSEPTSDKYEVLCDYCVPYGGGSNEFNNALEALAKSGSESNPYGYHKKSNGKYVFIRKESTSDSPGTGADNNEVIGLKPALRSNGLDETWAPEPEKLNDIDHYLDHANRRPCGKNFFDYVHNKEGVEGIFSIGENLNLRESPEGFSSDSILYYFIKKGFFPIFYRSTLWRSELDAQSPTHSGSFYYDPLSLSGIFYEDFVFSTEKTTYAVVTDGPGGITIPYAKFVSIPEIFRPRCVVSNSDNTDDADKGWGDIDKPLYAHSQYNYDNPQAPFDNYVGLWGTWDYYESFIQIVKVNEGIVSKKIKETYNDYYVDESILTLNSPDIDAVPQSNENIKLDVIGVIPLDSCQVNYDFTVDNFASAIGSIDYSNMKEHNEKEFSPFYSDFIYNDIGWSDNKLSSGIQAIYNTYLFGANNFLGITDGAELEDLKLTFSEFPGIIKKQQILNEYFSSNPIYFENSVEYGDVYYTKTDETGETSVFRTNKGIGIYRPSYTNLVISENTSHLYNAYGKKKNRLSLGNSMVKFSTSPHIVLNLQDLSDNYKKYLLPHFEGDTDYYRTFVDSKKYVWSGKVPDVSVSTVPANSRGEWSQSDDDDTINVLSIWEEQDFSALKACADYFLPVCYAVEGVSDEESAAICNSLKDVINGSQKISNILDSNDGNYRSSPTLHGDSYEIIDPDKEKLTVAIYAFEDRTPIGGGERGLFLTTNKGYISSFEVTRDRGNVNSTGEVIGVDSVTVEYETSPIVEASGEQIDDSVVYLEEDSPNLKLYFKWYKNKLVYKGSYPVIEYSPYIKRLNGFPVDYVSKEISFSSPTSNPYLYIGEVYYDIDGNSLYGGTDNSALRKLSWIPSSKVTSIEDGGLANPLTNMEGDTYYQRWDCLKTFPTTEEDVNQIVDITSFMVETHINLDARTDSKRASYSLMSRLSNFNLFNTVYNQKNNIFEYAVNWNKLGSEHIPNQIVWSMTKNYLGDVDSWTNTNTSSSTRVTYPVTKLVNHNNTVMALTEHSLEVVNFNAKQLVPATDNSFIELQNSKKVDGTTKLQAPYGSHNMSTLITEKGLYFIEDNEKSLIRLGGEAGITKVGATSMADWLRNHIVQGTYIEGVSKKPFRLEYDAVHKDVYIINDEYCLVYNETLESFVSFITYSGEYWLYNYGGKLFAYRLDSNEHFHIHEMYSENSYNGDFKEYNYLNGTWSTPATMEYSVWYRINPGPYTDKVFTNGTLMADIDTTGTNSLYPNSTKNNDRPFSTLRVWTEYQDTENVPLEHILDKPSLLKQKFRFWRFIIPRDVKSIFKRDRIRNPWIHLQLKGDSIKKMEFHNLTIQYME